MGASTEWAARVLRATRAELVRLCDHPFLVGKGQLRRPPRPQGTSAFRSFDPSTVDGSRPLDDAVADEDLPLVLPVRKVQASFPSMITVGRTENNDVVVPDVSVSRFHAFFRVSPGRVELGDAGSRNGTFIGTRRLVAKGPVEPIELGEVVRFASVAFALVDAGGCWDLLHAL